MRIQLYSARTSSKLRLGYLAVKTKFVQNAPRLSAAVPTESKWKNDILSAELANILTKTKCVIELIKPSPTTA